MAAPAAPAVDRPVPVASSEAGWPQFRGPRRDGVSLERGLLPAWPDGGPRRIWTTPGVGRGFSSPVVGGGRVFITGDVGEDLHVLALDLEGRVLWRAVNGRSWRKEYPGARSSVTLSAGRVYHQNAHGRVACFEAATGRELWAVELLQTFGGKNLTWGLSECLVVDDRAVYATAGGRDALLVALDPVTGAVRWRSEPLLDTEGTDEPETAGYASPILVSFAGRRLLVGVSLRHLYCADADTGRMQWTRRRPTSYSVQAMMPVLVDGGIFMTAPYGLPGRLYRLTPPSGSGGTVGVEEGWETRLDTCQGGVVVVGDRIYGSYYTPRKGWAAVEASSGRLLHEQGEFTKGSVLAADQRLYALAEDGWMLLLEPTDRSFEVRGRFRLADARARDAWAHPVVHEGRLYVRYHDTLSCFDVRAGVP
jgi:outer membrane protein assembly factor BamB